MEFSKGKYNFFFQKSFYISFTLLFIITLASIFINISIGSVYIPFNEVLKGLFKYPMEKDTWELILFKYRIPKAITIIFTGSGLGISGLLMQTLFRNPIAGPYVLGVSSGASLGVALLILGGSIFGGIFKTALDFPITISISAGLGALFVLFFIIILSVKLKNTIALLIIGLMFGSFASALINILSYFSDSKFLKDFLLWNLGALGNLDSNGIVILSICCTLGFIFVLTQSKSLNAFLLGENYALSVGVKVNKTRTLLLIASGIITGTITAFSGPIAFIGLAVPHITKLLLKTAKHQILIPGSALVGSIVLLVCDCISQLPGLGQTLPINAVTSIIGVPLVILLIIKKKKVY